MHHTLDRWGGVQDHRVVVGGRRAAQDLVQLSVVRGKSACAFADAPAACIAESRPGEVRKPRLLTLAGHSHAKEKKKTIKCTNSVS